jgi:hypothetical protein
MNTNEARLAVVGIIADVLFELSDDDDLSDDDRGDLRDSLADAADLILEALEFDVIAVNDFEVSARITLDDPDSDEN